MRVTYDPAKRERTLRERGLDFERAKDVLAGLTSPTCVATTVSVGSTRSVI
jgi:uncharacterized DUF497 family protein